ncbi:hypothetical protein DVR12_18225 [Chitinophaga silvatica]|uniref:Uncharacterized protein n=1 Tax=Chitinophaga silvatica TaxID=2282649 RepID=A0A3E1Y6D8_9BACT|nr:hypothetical protein [Chitinophaga silvatica]RFS20506.1 hypothetical protein DVR12_18225 [Chitinophaga silvatica]
MTSKKYSNIPPGWEGGFAQSNSAFAYPNPDLSSLPMLDNMDNISLLKRQQKVQWPEFSWEAQKGASNPDRCFVMFSPDISRIGYDNTGRVYSIICPQQGTFIPGVGTMNVEVTVTGQGGWVDESDTVNNLAADMMVLGKVWFSPSAKQTPFVKKLWDKFSQSNLPFPSDKKNAIKVTTHKAQDPNQGIFPVRKGETTTFESPDFAKHYEAYGVGNVEVQMGPIVKTNNEYVDTFNQLVLDLHNLCSGNMLQKDNILTWNVWFTEPSLVDQEEWKEHAELWRESIDVDHTSPTGEGRSARHFDGTPFQPIKELVDAKIKEIADWVEKHHP